MTQSRKHDTYYQGFRSDLLEWLGGKHGRVLEVGCGSGGNAAWLRDHGATRIVGIEIDQTSARRAKDVFDDVLVESVETAVHRIDGPFDLIICADVLEHLVDPWAVATDLAGLVADDGRLVVSIPNIRHYRALWRIAFGAGFRYDTEGTFDSTHLRFFDRAGVEALLDRSGWAAERWGGLGGGRLNPLISKRRLRRPAEFLVYQWYVVAGKAGR